MEPLTLETLEDDAWRWLTDALATRDSPLRTPVLGTVGTDGAPEARVVVLRAVDPEAWALDVHTDTRSAKVASLSERAAVTCLFWDPSRMIQLRAVGRASLHTGDALADAAWEAAPLASRAPYMSRRAPGAPIDAPEPGVFVRDEEHSRQGRPHFCVIRCAIERLDVLQLHPHGHRRAEMTPGAVHWVGA